MKQADIKMIQGEGMPTHKDPFNKGKLIVLFNITYPEKLDPGVAKKIAALLPKPQIPAIPSGAEDVHLEVFDGEHTIIFVGVETTLDIKHLFRIYSNLKTHLKRILELHDWLRLCKEVHCKWMDFA